ncbi:L,D-transpeptidase [Paraburkholderia solisilvae]|nr:L,D-transpeptidase [Paraburkholderia solisilvae]
MAESGGGIHACDSIDTTRRFALFARARIAICCIALIAWYGSGAIAFAAAAASDTPRTPAAWSALAARVAARDAVGGADPRQALLMREIFAHDVTRRLKVPPAEQRAYGARLQAALDASTLGGLSGEYVVLVDRNQNVQALFVYFRAVPADDWQLIGAAPVATGRPGQFDHFITPLGVFEHTPDNMDFRAEGTMNQNGIRGYGRHDMRIFDLGWAQGERGWGKGGFSEMRFQMHATDPDRLEPLLGIRHSKGCVRIPATLNAFLDHYGILDAEYENLIDSGRSLWVLHSDRQVTPWAGRYIVVVDSQRKARAAWSPAPSGAMRAKMPAGADTAD